MELTIGELKKERIELLNRLNSFTRKSNYLMMMKTRASIQAVDDAIADIERVERVGMDDVNNRHLKSWFGKSISLSINCNDLSIFYLDSTINFLRTKGLAPKGSFELAANEYRKAANNLRKEIAKFLIDYEDDNWEDFSDIEKLISDKKFTDREMVFKKQFEN